MNKKLKDSIWNNLKALQRFQIAMARNEEGDDHYANLSPKDDIFDFDHEDNEMDEEGYIRQEKDSHTHPV